MTERQIHGFQFEDYIINKFNFTKATSYTEKYDAYMGDIPVSIKTKKLGGAIEMADIFRNATIDKDFLLVVGFWSGTKDNIVKTHFLHIDKDFWLDQFPTNMITNILPNIFDGITNSHDDDKKWKTRLLLTRREWNSHKTYIRLNLKRDHKKTKRVHCSISKKHFNSIFLPKFEIESPFDLITK